ncbi:hypothetical protein GGX14DRAFT_405672 [Mycena pura]|uniref:Myb/SANT-like domain-containing protein n=1 Tax=Mycena pura TaxID=153505 RepID=A0AAD6URH7_9AGAR|nr:hypothetical protein GGX14DRAFT_405672 [Mycena pura]
MPSDKTWTKTQAEALLDALLDKKLTHQSGNGWKPSVWTDVISAVNAVDPASQKTSTQIQNKLKHLKGVYEDYQYVLGHTGTGWNDEAKHATNTAEYVEDFIRTHGDQYKRCFAKPCPYYDKLDELYDGAKSRATGEHVLLLGKKKKNLTSKTQASSKAKATKASKKTSANKENLDSDSDILNGGNGAYMAGPVTAEEGEGDGMKDVASDDELTVSPPKKKRARADSDDDDDAEKPTRRRSRFNSSGSTQRNADAGFAMAKSIEGLSNAISEPVVLKNDSSHIAQVVKILTAFPDLLPDDPAGVFYDAVTEAFGDNESKSCIFIATEDPVRRKGIIQGILRRANLVVA